ncbi:unnamed protein product [Alternaria burnsii]|nr:unnamed protein product [Alternaria burnsii]
MDAKASEEADAGSNQGKGFETPTPSSAPTESAMQAPTADTAKPDSTTTKKRAAAQLDVHLTQQTHNLISMVSAFTQHALNGKPLPVDSDVRDYLQDTASAIKGHLTEIQAHLQEAAELAGQRTEIPLYSPKGIRGWSYNYRAAISAKDRVKYLKHAQDSQKLNPKEAFATSENGRRVQDSVVAEPDIPFKVKKHTFQDILNNRMAEALLARGY